ncbi:MAG: thioredoxin domain-containing protein [Thermoanaerobaculia bacterium]|nr:thioredoxin domain-containing protein [Thermoanaerobaculia bacterium]
MSKANRLINETSPYLLQHAHNPVDWYPWGEEAFRRAREEGKPVFLSIGYSACHWCHVMERESFEDAETAAQLNAEWISIKVDREERPDIDSIYMTATQMLTGHGGWPMSVFLTPDAKPFYAGTYFPPAERHGMPSFRRVLSHLSHLYRDDREKLVEASEEIHDALVRSSDVAGARLAMNYVDLDAAAARLAANYDRANGGFGGAPKFPPSMSLDFLMRVADRNDDPALREIVVTTLRRMARGGIFDQAGGGFHRYSVDARWLAPHFEKMLYDNALLARLYVRAWQWTRDEEFRRVANETLDFVVREMTSPEGGFYSTLDADSEGVEGKFYVWSREEVMSLLGDEEGGIFCALFDVTDRGNWEGHNILNLPRDPVEVAAALGVTVERLAGVAARGRCALYGRRAERVRPGRDEKILAGWNGWMLAAFSEAAMAFDSDAHRAVARGNAEFLLGKMFSDGKLHRSYKDGRVKIGALLEDVTGVAWGLLAAFEALQERRWLDAAKALAEDLLARFQDREDAGFFDTPDDHEALITRPRDVFDNATPAGTSVAIDVLQRLAILFGDERYARAATTALESVAPIAMKHPSGFGFILGAAEFSLAKVKEIVITGPDGDDAKRALIRVAGESYLPHRVLISSDQPGLPLSEGRDPQKLAAYVCEGYACAAPTADVEELRRLLG